MKISIVTVAYNSERTIRHTLASVAQQTYSDIEHIVVDGGSIDGTTSIVRRYGERVSTLISEPDDGVYSAMNKGLRVASGDYVGFLNADDVLADSEAVSRMVRTLAATGADMVYSDLVYVRRENSDSVVRIWRGGEFKPSRLKYGWMPPHPTFYVRRDRLSDVGEFDSSLRIAADYDFMIRCLKRSDMSVAYSPGVFVRMRTGGISNKSFKNLRLKSREDLVVLRRENIGGICSLALKNLRKLAQLLTYAHEHRQ